MQKRSRLIVGSLFVAAATVCSLAAGTIIGGRFVPAGSGLAGPAIAFGYGLIGAMLGGIAGATMAWRLPSRWLIGATVPTCLLGGVCLALFGWVYTQSSAAQRAHLEEAYRKLPGFQVRIAYPPVGTRPFAEYAVDWASRRYSIVTTGDKPQRCTAQLSGPDAVRLLGALREVGAVMLRDPYPCAGTLGALEYELDWRIDESPSAESAGRLAITATCLDHYPGLGTPVAVAREIDSPADKGACRDRDGSDP